MNSGGFLYSKVGSQTAKAVILSDERSEESKDPYCFPEAGTAPKGL